MEDGTVRITTNLRKGVLEFCVLALLSGDPRYGVDLAVRLRDAGLIASEGTLYPLLSRLRSAKHVDTRWQESPQGPPRRYYTITESGRRQLDSFVDVWPMLRDNVNEILKEAS